MSNTWCYNCLVSGLISAGVAVELLNACPRHGVFDASKLFRFLYELIKRRSWVIIGLAGVCVCVCCGERCQPGSYCSFFKGFFRGGKTLHFAFKTKFVIVRQLCVFLRAAEAM